MEAGTVMKAIIAGVVLIVIVMVVVIPVLGDASYDQKTTQTAPLYFAPVEDATITASGDGYNIDGVHTAINGNVILISESLVLQHVTNTTKMTLYDYASNTFGSISSFTISGTTYSTAGTTEATGNIGDNAIIFTNDTEKATYGRWYSAAFFVDKSANVMSWRTASLSDGTNTADARTLCVGPVDDLEAKSVNFVSDTFTPYTSMDAVTNTNSYSEPNSKVFEVAGNPTINYTGVLNGTTYTGNSGASAMFYAPLEYTKVTGEGQAIESMIGIVPLLMIVGVIIMIIGAAVIRR